MGAVAFTPDSRSFFTLAAGSIRRWTVRTVQQTGSFEPAAGQAGRLMAMALSPDGTTLAIGGGPPGLGFSSPGLIWLWDTASGRLRSRLEHPAGGEVVSLAFTRDGKRLATGSQAGGVCLWDLASEQPRHRVPLGGVIWAVAFSPDGKTLATGSSDHTIHLWDADKGTLRASLPEHDHLVLALAFSPDGKRLASGSYDETLRLWDVERRAVRLSLSLGGWVHAVAFSPDGKTLAIGLRDKTEVSALRLLDLKAAGGRL